MNSALKAFINEITVDSKCSLNEMLTEFYKYAGIHFSFNGISEDEKVNMRKITEGMNMNETFVKHFLEHFTEHVTPLGLFEVVKHIDTIADSIDVRIGLEKIFKHPSASEHMKDYVKVWLMQPLQVMEKLQEFLAQMMFDDEQILNVALKDKTLFTKAVKKALIHPEDFNLVSFIVYNENNIPARIHSLTEEVLSLDVAGIVSVDDIRERIVSIKIDDVKGPETGLEGLRNATECLLKIHQAYPTMQANMINYSTRSINSSMMGGAKLSAARVVRLYAGDYTDYANAEQVTEEQTTPEQIAENSPVRGLITNPEGFNALSASARRLVSQHLPATRKQFNQIIVNAINSVHTWMPQLINAKTSNRELNRVIDGLAKSYNSISGQQGMVDWFMHKFAPAVNAYRARGFAPTGIAVIDNVFGGSPMKNVSHIYGSGMSGGVRTVYVNNNEDTGSHRIFGGGVIGEYFEGVKRAQLKFNEQFDNLYRKLTAAVRNVADKQQFTSEEGISRVIESLMSITISSKKTVMKISGLRPKEDLNTRYTAMVEHVIKTIENTKLGGFGEVIGVLRSIVGLLKGTRGEAQSLIKRVSEGTKSSEEIVKYISFEHDELPSKLTPQELHALVESINALIYANHGHPLTAKIERHREEDVKDYIKKVTNRTEAINDYYENLIDGYLKYNRDVDVDTRSFIKTHLKSIQTAMVYFNEKVDTKLMQWRQKMAKGANITKKQVDDIERLTMTYMHYRPGEKVLQIFSKLEKLRREVKTELSIGDLYKVTEVIQKIVMHAGYVEMIQELYKVLEIDSDGFDWNLFKINLTKLLVDKLLCIDYQRIEYKLDSDKPTTEGNQLEKGTSHQGFSTAGMYDFVKAIYEKIKGQDAFKTWGYNMLFNLCIAAFSKNGNGETAMIPAALGITDTSNICGNYTIFTKQGMIANGVTAAKIDEGNGIWHLKAYNIHVNEYVDEKGNETPKIRNLLDSIGITNKASEFWSLDELNKDDYTHQENRVKFAMLEYILGVLAKNKVYGVYDKNHLQTFVNVMFDSFIQKPDNTKAKETFVMLKALTPKLGITWDGYFSSSSRETIIITDVFHAMIANVLYVFNRYIALRYTGTEATLPIPIMSNAMLGGNLDDNFATGSSMEGTRMDAGSAIDVIGVHDLKFDKVIPEAVPFYAIALDIFATFMTKIYAKYNTSKDRPAEKRKEELGDKAFGMYVTISEFSLLHQLHEILKEYTSVASIRGDKGRFKDSEYFSPLTEVQIKMIIAELNKVWNLVSGSGKEKLMNAIDYVIGEINASILFTSKSRYEQLKRDGYTDIDVSTKVEQQFNGLIDELQNAINDNLKIVQTMNPDAMREFESFLTISVEKVAKETNETARLNYVREIINSGKQNVYKTPFEDYYKFCEFVITPIMITATSYKNLFNLLNQVNVNIEGESLHMNLGDYNVAIAKEGTDQIFHEQSIGNLIDGTSMVNVYDICKEARSAKGLTGTYFGAAAALINSPVVAEYNTILIKRALQQAFIDNRPFSMPELWLPLIPSTYPEHQEIRTTFHSTSQKGSIRNVHQANIALHELYPNIKSDNVIDFANAMLGDFSADFDHLLHTFMTFPGISDRFLMKLKSVHENATTSLKNLMQKGLWDGADFLFNSLKDKKLTAISIVVVPRYPTDMNIQAYTGTVNVPALTTQKSGSVSSDSYSMEGTGQIIHSLSLSSKQNLSTSGNQTCMYGPLDWIIYKLASCNTTGYTLPVMLYELLKTNTLIGKHLVECAIDGSKVIYLPHSSGYVYNIVTQNILTRSATDRNRQESAELKNMNKTWLANLVSVIPGLISYISSLAKSTNKDVREYNGINIEQLNITLTTILESFYEECVPLMPFIPFMSDYVPGTYYSSIERKLSKYHSIAEIYQAIADPKCELDGLKFEWANRPYYINGLQIPFPEYKNRDKFEGLKKWGGSIFQNSLFADEFSGTMDIIARAVVRSRIIKRNASTVLAGEPTINTNTSINTGGIDPIPLCIKTIKKCYEMDPVVIGVFISNIIRKLRSTSTGMLGGYVSFTLGRDDKMSNIGNSAINRIKELLNGIFTINGTIEGYKFKDEGTIEYDINSAISLLYDNPNIRPFYGFADDGKDIYKSASNLVFLHFGDNDIKGALKLAAEKVTVDASTRGKELLAFSVVNQKPVISLNDDTFTDRYGGTIATSARYASKNNTSGLKLSDYRKILRDSVYNSDIIESEFTKNMVSTYDEKIAEKQQGLSTLIEGYANTSRLIIAANALSAAGLNILRLTGAENIFTVNGNQDVKRPFVHNAIYEIFNWLSLDIGGKMPIITVPAVVAGTANTLCVRPIGIDDGVDLPGNVKTLVNTGDNTRLDQVVDELNRWDKIGEDLQMRLRAMNPYIAEPANPGADPYNDTAFDARGRIAIGKILRALIYAINTDTLLDLDTVIGAAIANSGANLGDTVARAAATADDTDTTDFIGKAFEGDAGARISKVTEAIFNVTTEQTAADNVDAFTIPSDSFRNIERLAVLYALLTRRTGLIVEKLVDANANKVNDAGSVIVQFIKMLGFANLAAITGVPATRNNRLIAICHLLATIIEITMRTSTKGNIISFTNIFGPKIATYLDTIEPPLWNHTTAADANLQARDTHAHKLHDALISGKLALSLFDLFYNGSTSDKIKNLTTVGNASLFNNTDETINGLLWSSVLSEAKYTDAFIGANNINARFVTGADGQPRYDIKCENYAFVPLTPDGNNRGFKPLEFGTDNKVKLFDKEYTLAKLVTTDTNELGFGEPAGILNAITTTRNGYTFTNFVADRNVRPVEYNLAEQIYNNGSFDVTRLDSIGDSSTVNFADLLRMLGFLSLARSPLYSTIIKVNTGAGTADVNLLLKSFAWKRWQHEGGDDTGFNIDDPAIYGLPLLNIESANDTDVQQAVYNAHTNLAYILAVQRKRMKLTDILKRDSIRYGITSRVGRQELNKAADCIVKKIESRYLYNITNDSLKTALGYNRQDGDLIDIGTSTRTENNLRLTQLPTIEPRIVPIDKLTAMSVKLYQLLPRSISEYMLWNPGYEIANLITSVNTRDRMHIPFDNIIDPTYSYPLDDTGATFDTTKTGNLVINNVKLLHYTLSVGLLDNRLSAIGEGPLNDWYTIFSTAAPGFRNAGVRGVAFTTHVYETDNESLKPKAGTTQTTMSVDYDPSSLITKLSSIIDEWCNSFTAKAGEIPQTNGWSLNMLGGDITFTTYINKDNISAGEPYKIYPAIYPTTDGESGLAFYNKLFRTLKTTSESIGSLALTYFNRSLLTFSGVLSNFVYPNAIYGKSIFNKFAEGLGNAIGKVAKSVYTSSTKLFSESESVKRRWDFYTLYAENFCKEINGQIVNVSDRTLYALNQCMFEAKGGDNTRKSGIRKFEEMTVANLAESFTHGYRTGTSATANVQGKLSSEFTAPSICNSFLTILHNLIIGKTNDKSSTEARDDLAHMEWFMGTETMGALRSIDSLLTYTSVIASLIKQLSFYDMDEGMERTYIPRDPAEPFMGVEPNVDKF